MAKKKRSTRRRKASTKRRRGPRVLRRGTYRVNPRSRRRRRSGGGKFGLGKFLPVSMTDVAYGAAGAVAVPMLLSKFGAGKFLPATTGADGKPNPVGYLAQAAVGAVLAGFIGRMMGKQRIGAAIALGAAIVPTAALFAAMKPLGEVDQGDFLDLSGGEYATAIEGGMYSEVGASDDVSELDFLN